MNNNFSKQYQFNNAEVAEYFDTLPTSVQEIIMQDNHQFNSKEEIQAFTENILGKKNI